MKLYELLREPRIIEGNVRLSLGTTRLDFHNTVVNGNFFCMGTQIASLAGSPIKVNGEFNCSENTNIKSLKGCPKEVTGDFVCEGTSIKSLHNIHKYIYRIGVHLYIPDGVKSHILGVLKIKGLQALAEQMSEDSDRLGSAVNIVNKYIEGIPHPKDRDIHQCQIDLIEAGHAKYAQL